VRVRVLCAVIVALILCSVTAKVLARTQAKESMGGELSYTSDGRMVFPEHYREWTYVTSGMDMSYTASGAADHHMFDNVFVTPASYRSFLESGKWPDRTVFVLEVRGAQSGVSINQRGLTQSPEVMGYEVHVKDSHLPGGFGFFEFDEKHVPAMIVARPASCYSCHEMHGAVDTTFVQFYPTLFGVAKQKGTIRAEFLKEIPPAR
jgi:hypothetical protein